MKEQAIDRYGYFFIVTGVYYALSGSSKNSFKSLLKSIVIQSKIKNGLAKSLFVIFCFVAFID